MMERDLLPGSVTAYAPASIGNFAAGFDLLGAALAPLDGSLLGDLVHAAPAPEPSFQLEGPFAEALAGDTRPNLVLRAADLYREALKAMGRPAGPFALRLEKRLPVASGLGPAPAPSWRPWRPSRPSAVIPWACLSCWSWRAGPRAPPAAASTWTTWRPPSSAACS